MLVAAASLLAAWVAAGLVLVASEDAAAVTLKLAFADGRPMTYGSACSGHGCLQRGAGIEQTDAGGRVVLADAPDQIVEYRRDGVDLSLLSVGSASGRVQAVGERTVVLPRLLPATAPAVDAVEADVLSRINAERSARGLALAQLDWRLAAAADHQATWLSGSALGLELPVLSHFGPFGSTTAFRLGAVSFPEPASGSEIAAAGLTPADALTVWMASAPHRDQVLAPGGLLIGVAAVGNVIIVDTHPPCDGCPAPAPAPTRAPSPASSAAPGVAGGGTRAPSGTSGASGRRDGTAAGTRGTSPVSGSSGDRASSCGAERLRVRRLRNRHRRVRLRVSVRCLARGADYKLSVMQRPSRSILTKRTITRAATITLSLRPARTTRVLRVKLRRNGRVVSVRSVFRNTG